MPGSVLRPHLVEELSKDVIAVLDKDRSVEAKLSDIASKGRKALKDLQLQQEKHNVALGAAFDACLRSQSEFQEENQRLLGSVQALLGMLVPNAFDTAATPWTYWPCQATNYYSGLAPHLSASSDGSFSFTVTLRKADGSSLGLAIAHSDGDEALLVEGVVAGGAVDAWNRQCLGGFGQPHKVVQPGDQVIAVNGISKDTAAMLKECGAKRLVKITILRESQAATGIVGELQQQAPAAKVVKGATEKERGMRTDAPEFVPRGLHVDADAPTPDLPSCSSSSAASSPFPSTLPSPPPSLTAVDTEEATARAVVQSVPRPPPGLLQPRRLWAKEGIVEETQSDHREEKCEDDSFLL